MRRIICFVLLAVMIVSALSCGEHTSTTTTGGMTASTATETTSPSVTETTQASTSPAVTETATEGGETAVIDGILYDKEKNENSGYYKSGTLVASDKYISTGFIEVSGGKNVGFGRITADYLLEPVIECYNAEKEFVSNITMEGLTLEFVTSALAVANTVIPEGISYIRINFAKDQANTFVVAEEEKMTAEEYYEIIGEEKQDKNTDSVLYGKSVLFIGDSLCEASTDTNSKFSWANTNGMGGWAARFAYYDNMKVTKTGVSGRSLAKNSSSSGFIADQLTANKNRTFDYVIIEGGVNDGWFKSEIGKMSESFDKKDFDTSTFAGGFEYTIALAKEYFPDATLGFIQYFRVTISQGNLKDMDAYWSEAVKICEKWKLPVLDLYFNEDICNKYGIPYIVSIKSPIDNMIFEREVAKITKDGCHPNGTGYDRLYNAINDFMISITPDKQ